MGHIVTIIYKSPFSNHLREGMGKGFDLFGLNRFGVLPGGAPDTAFEDGGCFWTTSFLESHEVHDFFGICGLGLSFFRLTLNFPASSFCFRFAFGIRRHFHSQNPLHLTLRLEIIRNLEALKKVAFSTAQKARPFSYQTNPSCLIKSSEITRK